jgi:hypothetical protein
MYILTIRRNVTCAKNKKYVQKTIFEFDDADEARRVRSALVKSLSDIQRDTTKFELVYIETYDLTEEGPGE